MRRVRHAHCRYRRIAYPPSCNLARSWIYNSDFGVIARPLHTIVYIPKDLNGGCKALIAFPHKEVYSKRRNTHATYPLDSHFTTPAPRIIFGAGSGYRSLAHSNGGNTPTRGIYGHHLCLIR